MEKSLNQSWGWWADNPDAAFLNFQSQSLWRQETTWDEEGCDLTGRDTSAVKRIKPHLRILIRHPDEPWSKNISVHVTQPENKKMNYYRGQTCRQWQVNERVHLAPLWSICFLIIHLQMRCHLLFLLLILSCRTTIATHGVKDHLMKTEGSSCQREIASSESKVVLITALKQGKKRQPNKPELTWRGRTRGLSECWQEKTNQRIWLKSWHTGFGKKSDIWYCIYNISNYIHKLAFKCLESVRFSF